MIAALLRMLADAARVDSVSDGLAVALVITVLVVVVSGYLCVTGEDEHGPILSEADRAHVTSTGHWTGV